MKATKNALVLLFLAAGCRGAEMKPAYPDFGDMWVGDHVRREQAEEAVRAERALYPHHFVAHSAGLSPLGEKHLGILAADLAATPGAIAIRRGDAGEELYALRTQTVRDGLVAAGLDPGTIAVGDGSPAGPGAASERVIEVLEEEVSTAQTQSLINQIGGSQ